MISLFSAIVALLNASKLSREERVKCLENCLIWARIKADRERSRKRAA